MQRVKMKHGVLKHKSLNTSKENSLICQSVMAKYCQFLGTDMKAVEAFYKVSFRMAEVEKSPFNWRVLTVTTTEDMTSSVVMLTVC